MRLGQLQLGFEICIVFYPGFHGGMETHQLGCGVRSALAGVTSPL
jgi:hypothetical protein